MALIYEVPTHLNVEDTLILGLTPRQLLRISVGASLAYFVWEQTSPLADGARVALTAAFVLFGVLFGLCQPAGRPLDQWLLAAVLFSALPRRRVWRLLDCSARNDHVGSSPDWAELSPIPAWLRPAATDPRADHNQPRDGQSVHWRWPR
jgi:PrgI family protein